MELIFASNNMHKIREVEAMLGSGHKLLSLADAGISGELAEDFETLEDNARQKARQVLTWSKIHAPVFADDTGLEVQALDGRPGAFSARYAGLPPDPVRNIRKLLEELDGITDRRARFRTVVCLLINKEEHLFEGIVNGRITTGMHGSGGFGYDPVFIPEGHIMTFAEMTDSEKNSISHRARAIERMRSFFF